MFACTLQQNTSVFFLLWPKVSSKVNELEKEEELINYYVMAVYSIILNINFLKKVFMFQNVKTDNNFYLLELVTSVSACSSFK